MRALLLLLVGCADVAQPFELDHARVMAIRVDPPTVPAGEPARIEVLVTDAEHGPHLATEVSVEAIGATVGRDDRGWYAIGDGTLPIVPLEITAEILPAQKTLAIGARAENPATPIIEGIDRIAIGMEATLSIEGADDALSYRWFSSIGDLTGYTRAEATLDPIAARGAIVAVVRDQAGGTNWTIAPVEVQP